MIVILSLGWRKKMLVLVLSGFLTLNLGFGQFLATEKIGKLDMSGFKVEILVASMDSSEFVFRCCKS